MILIKLYLQFFYQDASTHFWIHYRKKKYEGKQHEAFVTFTLLYVSIYFNHSLHTHFTLPIICQLHQALAYSTHSSFVSIMYCHPNFSRQKTTNLLPWIQKSHIRYNATKLICYITSLFCINIFTKLDTGMDKTPTILVVTQIN